MSRAEGFFSFWGLGFRVLGVCGMRIERLELEA